MSPEPPIDDDIDTESPESTQGFLQPDNGEGDNILPVRKLTSDGCLAHILQRIINDCSFVPRKNTRVAGTLIVVALCVLSVGLVGTAGASQAHQQNTTEINSCTTIEEPGHYELTNNIRDSDEGVCIDIQSGDVHFDGNGHLVEGNLSRASIENASDGPAPRTRVGVGVNVRADERVSNVTVENVTTTNWFHGILSENVSEGITRTVTTRNNGGGIIYDNSSDVAVLNSTSSNNVILGIIIDSRAGVPSADNRVVNNTAEQNGFFGVAVFLSNNSVVADNTLSENVFGIFAYGTSESTFADNDAQNNSAVGFALEGDVEPTVQEPVEAAEPRVPELNTSQNNVVVGNDFSESGAIGMGFIGPSETYVADNNVSDIPDNAPFPVGYPSSGLYLDESSNNVIVNNDASRINGSGGLNGTGIVLANSSSFVSTTWPRNTSVYQESLTSSGGLNGPRTPLSTRRASTIVSA